MWNRSKTATNYTDLLKEGAKTADTPAAVVAACGVVFCMVSDPDAALAVVFGPGGVLEGMGPGKAYVDVSTGKQASSSLGGTSLYMESTRCLQARPSSRTARGLSADSPGWRLVPNRAGLRTQDSAGSQCQIRDLRNG